MIKIPRDKVAIIPVFDSDETKGGIVKPAAFNYLLDKVRFDIIDMVRNKKIDEAEDVERAKYLCERYTHRGYKVLYKKVKVKDEGQPLEAGERCDQGVVKYIGVRSENKEPFVSIGDYVFFSGYTGTLVEVEGEGKLIILPEDFIEFIFDIDKFITVPGLYFKSRDGTYFEATYETAMNIMARNFTDLGMTLDVKTQQPTYEEYNVR